MNRKVEFIKGEKCPMKVNGGGLIFTGREFLLFFKDMNYRPEQEKQFEEGAFTFDVAVKEDIVFLLYQFSLVIPLGYCVFNGNLYSSACNHADLEENQGYAVNLFLVDEEEVIRGMRSIFLSHEMSVKINELLDMQRIEKFDRKEFAARSMELAKRTTPKQLYDDYVLCGIAYDDLSGKYGKR